MVTRRSEGRRSLRRRVGNSEEKADSRPNATRVDASRQAGPRAPGTRPLGLRHGLPGRIAQMRLLSGVGIQPPAVFSKVTCAVFRTCRRKPGRFEQCLRIGPAGPNLGQLKQPRRRPTARHVLTRFATPRARVRARWRLVPARSNEATRKSAFGLARTFQVDRAREVRQRGNQGSRKSRVSLAP